MEHTYAQTNKNAGYNQYALHTYEHPEQKCSYSRISVWGDYLRDVGIFLH
jgi:hypothetical protein